ncbi:hypothetical protein V8B97DRAFT_1916280 [Scleroderma yunnanense]
MCHSKMTVLDGWSTIGKLVDLLWHTTIENTETYLTEGNSTKATLSHTIEDFLPLSAQCAPRGYWMNPTTMQWVKAGDGVLEYMDKNSKQQHLIGATHLSTSTIESKSRKFIPPVEWQTTLSAKVVLSTSNENLSKDLFYKVNSFVTVNGTVKQVAEPQEHLVITGTKDLVSHSPINAFLLNTHALHNYQHLAAVIPPSLHSQLNVSLITDHEIICLNAAKAVHAKKVTEDSEPNITPEKPVQTPAFDGAKRGSKRKGKGKEKGKATVIGNTQVI